MEMRTRTLHTTVGGGLSVTVEQDRCKGKVQTSCRGLLDRVLAKSERLLCDRELVNLTNLFDRSFVLLSRRQQEPYLKVWHLGPVSMTHGLRRRKKKQNTRMR